MSRTQFLDRSWNEWRPEKRQVLWTSAFVVQALSVLLYVEITNTEITAVRYLVYPFVWIDVSAWAVLHVSSNPGNRAHRAVAFLVSGGYLAVMLYVAGFIGSGSEVMTGWRVITAPPGWGPMVAYQSHLIRLYLVPFQVIGYLALAYLLYTTLLDATRAAVSGIFGLVSCVGCTWTFITPFAAGLAGASTVGATLYDWSYDLTTVVFLITVGLLIRAIEQNES